MLTRLIKKKFEQYLTFKPVIINASWLFLDKMIRMGGNTLLTIWLARYLGPSQFGLWSYAIAFSSIFGALAALGLDTIVVRELVKNPNNQNKLLGTVFILKLIGGLLALFVSMFAILMVRINDAQLFWMVTLTSASFIFHAFNVVDLSFQSKIQSKYTVIATNSAFILSALAKVYCLMNDATLMTFIWIGLVESMILAILLIVVFYKKGQGTSKWAFDSAVAKQLLRDSWPLMLSGIAVLLYMRIDQIMIAEMVNDTAVGVYSAAVRLSEIWGFIPVIIVASIFPSIIKIKQKSNDQYYKNLKFLFTMLVILALGVAIPVSFFSSELIVVLYGDEYAIAGEVLSIHVWSSIFMFLGVASQRWFVIEKLQLLSFYRTVVGIICNVIGNYILIPSYGIIGAAYATLITQFIVAYLFDLFTPKTRRLFMLKTKCLFPIDIFK